MSIQNLEEKLDASIISIKGAIIELKNNIMDVSNKQIECAKKKEILHTKDLEISERENKLINSEREYSERIENLILKEKQIEKEQEDNRKVSILKNIQIQLSQKISECELLSKQLKLYKSRSELLNNLCNKHNINIAALTFMIEKTIILEQLSIEHKSEKKEPIIAEPIIAEPIIAEPIIAEPTKIETPDELNNKINEENKVIEEVEEGIEEGIEVNNFDYKGKQYYIDDKSGDIYAKLEDDEVGDIIGYRTEKGIVKFGHRKK